MYIMQCIRLQSFRKHKLNIHFKVCDILYNIIVSIYFMFSDKKITMITQIQRWKDGLPIKMSQSIITVRTI